MNQAPLAETTRSRSPRHGRGARRRAGSVLCLSALLAVAACGSAESEEPGSGAATSGKAAGEKAATSGAKAEDSGPDLINLPAKDICALVPLKTLDGLAVAPATDVVTEEGVNQVHCFFNDADGETVAGISLAFDYGTALADTREVYQKKKAFKADLPELGEDAFYGVDVIFGKPALARVVGLPPRHADMLITSLNSDLDSGRLPGREAAVSWYKAVLEHL